MKIDDVLMGIFEPKFTLPDDTIIATRNKEASL